MLDPSSDETEEISLKAASADPRFIVLRNRWKGIAGALNTGILAASGELIARMDADDISLPNRLEQQVRFMDSNPEVGVLGTAFEAFGRSERPFVVCHPTNPLFNCFHLCADSILGHPTVVMRRSLVLLAGGYDASHPAEDMALFATLARRTRLANLETPLLRYREHGANLSAVHREKVVQSSISIGRLHVASVLGSDRAHSLLRAFILSPRSLGLMRRTQGLFVALSFVHRIRKLYRIHILSKTNLGCLWAILRLYRGWRFHG